MRNKSILILLVLLLTMGISAASSFASVNTSYFTDEASIVSSEDQKKISARLANISNEQNCCVYLMTTDDFQGLSVQEFADNVYDSRGMGYGSSHSGILLVVNFDSGDWAITTTGDGIRIFTDAGQQYLMEQVTENLREDPVEAFSVYADQCEDFIIQAANGEPYDNGNLPKDFNLLFDIPIGILIGVVIAAIIVGKQKAALKTVRRQAIAKDYMRPGSFKLTEQDEQYLYKKVDRMKKESSDNSSGSSTHTSSSGTTHGGSSGKF